MDPGSGVVYIPDNLAPTLKEEDMESVQLEELTDINKKIWHRSSLKLFALKRFSECIGIKTNVIYHESTISFFNQGLRFDDDH